MATPQSTPAADVPRKGAETYLRGHWKQCTALFTLVHRSPPQMLILVPIVIIATCAGHVGTGSSRVAVVAL